MKALKIIFIMSVLIGIIGWTYNRYFNIPREVDSWLRIPPMEIIENSYENSSNNAIQFCSIIPQKENEAVFLLRDKPLIRITQKDSKIYCNEDAVSSKNEKKEPFLVRALVIVEDAADYYVITQTAGNLWVDNPALPRERKGKIKMNRHALVVFLSERPSEVYVTTGLMAEWN